MAIIKYLEFKLPKDLFYEIFKNYPLVNEYTDEYRIFNASGISSDIPKILNKLYDYIKQNKNKISHDIFEELIENYFIANQYDDHELYLDYIIFKKWSY